MYLETLSSNKNRETLASPEVGLGNDELEGTHHPRGNKLEDHLDNHRFIGKFPGL